MMVQITMPREIIITETYFEMVYFFFKMMIPIIMLAISDPWKQEIVK